jgi:hypothetical protein
MPNPVEDFPMVQHAVGKLGWVIAKKDDGDRPAFRVLTIEGQTVWWKQDRCKFVNPTHFGFPGKAP